jgi:SAM-dependent methyltransferase
MSDDQNYDKDFYAKIEGGSHRSALVLVKTLTDLLGPIGSVVDFGCGSGVWLAEFRRGGATKIYGLDFGVGASAKLAIDPACYRKTDLGAPIQVAAADLCVSLEVAEHISKNCADTFVDNLTKASARILFSAAVPNQMGDHHVNEQPPAYWIEKFAARDFVCLDVIRPLIWNDSRVCWWYRQNCLFFVHRSQAELIARLSPMKSFHDAWLVHPEAFAERQKWLMGVLKDEPTRATSDGSGESAESLLRRLHRSTFWKLTKPLHWLSSAARKIDGHG